MIKYRSWLDGNGFLWLELGGLLSRLQGKCQLYLEEQEPICSIDTSICSIPTALLDDDQGMVDSNYIG